MASPWPDLTKLDPRAVADTRAWVNVLRGRGYQPLPSRPDIKRPFLPYAEYWRKAAPLDELWRQFPSTNCQVMLGVHWGLAVIDLDGPEAIDEWPKLGPRIPQTWVSHSGGGGRHLWFSVPRAIREIRKRVIWAKWDESAGGWERHKAIELLCDGSLIMCPPSIHPRTGRVYKWLDKGHSPLTIQYPAPLPAWVLRMPAVVAPRAEAAPVPVVEPRDVDRPRYVPWRARDVLEAIHDKTALAVSWGLRLATHRENAAGWMQCHAIGREDRTPSASWSESKGGRYWEPGEHSVGLFEFAVRLGVYVSYWDAVFDLGVRYRVRRGRSSVA